MDVPNYTAALRARPTSILVGVAHDFFFEGLEPEIETPTNQALSVLQKLTAGITEVAISARGQEDLRALVRGAEAYAYHAELIRQGAELDQPETLGRLRSGANIATLPYMQC